MRAVLLTAATGLVLVSGVIDGVWSNRWGTRLDMRAAAARLEELPLELGPWRGQAAKLDAREAQAAELAGSVLRKYTNRQTGDTAQVLLVCGHPGAVSVHTPDVCYAGAGYAAEGPLQRYEHKDPAGRTDAFVVGDMARTAPGGSDRLRIFWSWSDGTSWQAPRRPRLTFARAPILYKLYVLRAPPGAAGPTDKDPCADLIGRLLPETDRIVARTETPVPAPVR